ncbi:taste receptor type 2 member 113-like [Sphaerodactylus townsendi]|uniref:taste receptor type 2 member 113-like n=1 Tax=Sphaerodactylus townsendi TaxID=933632 RepID=UPI00202732F7|nr:taste receptor type 2 member 113-like [Sphaerodactylus townsendi]
MASSLWITGFALLAMETFAGIVANGFIVLINCVDWFRSGQLSSTDLILICLGLSRLMGQALAMLHQIMQFVIAVTAPNFLPLVIFLSSTILLIISLWKHIRHLQNNGIRVRDLNTNVHLNALKVLVSFAVLYLSSFVAMTLKTMLIWVNIDHNWTVVFFHNVSALYPSVHGVILILINPKLRQAWVRMIQHLKCPLRKPPS